MLKIRKNIFLAEFTTFRIGGPARYFVEVGTEEELMEALKYAQDNKLEYFVLGGGSNLLVSDKGFDGLVIKIENAKCKIQGTRIEASAGISLAELVKESTENSLAGMEWAAGIPGTIGGAVRGNAGAFGGDMMGVIESVDVLNVKNLKVLAYDQSQCEFGYRESIFKKNKDLIILSATIKLSSGSREEIRKKTREIIRQRTAKQPKGMPSAGSFFVNPAANDPELIKEFEKDSGKISRDGKVPAPWLIEKAGIKGKKIGGAMISEVHANYIVNTGKATAEDVIILASFIKQQVRDKFGIQLKEEVQYLGFN